MTVNATASYLDRLDQAARSASIAEDAYRKEAMERIKLLERQRAFAFRRLNLVRAVAASLAEAKDEAEAAASGSAALLRELNWNGASESQREVVNRFLPVVAALWRMREGATADADVSPADAALAEFETWFAANRHAPFESLMDTEVLELPLVEV
jgi:hypothetical protein